VQLKEKAPYFVLENFILYTSPTNLEPKNSNMNSQFANFIMLGKLKKLRIFPSARMRAL